jgi:hypothetical protein
MNIDFYIAWFNYFYLLSCFITSFFFIIVKTIFIYKYYELLFIYKLYHIFYSRLDYKKQIKNSLITRISLFLHAATNKYFFCFNLNIYIFYYQLICKFNYIFNMLKFFLLYLC